MSILVASNLQDRSSARSLTMDMTVECSVKAFVAFNGQTMGQTTSFNISSIIDAGVGNYQPYYVAGMKDWNIPVGSCHFAGSFWAYASLAGMYPTLCNVLTTNISAPATAADVNCVTVSTTGKLA